MAQLFRINDLQAFRIKAGKSKPLVIVIDRLEQGGQGLEQGVLEGLPVPVYADSDRSLFIKDYIDCIARLNGLYKDQFLWWATNLSSKNRYLCPLPDLVLELQEIDLALRTFADCHILIVAPSLAIQASLRKLLSGSGRTVFWQCSAIGPLRGCVINSVLKSAGLFYNAFKIFARSFYARALLGHQAGEFFAQRRPCYVIKTFSYGSSWDKAGQYTDPFFGELAGYLRQEGKKVLTLSYHWQGFRHFIKQVKRPGEEFILPVEFFISLQDILGAVIRILSFRIPLPGKVDFRGLDITATLAYELACNLNGIQLFQLLHYDAVRRLSKCVAIETFLFTFENNPWERMCMLACRQCSSTTFLIGYQHSVVPPAALNMFVSSLERLIVPLPDKVLTTGEVSASILKQYGDYSATEITPACALRYAYLEGAPVKPRARKRRVLVVLDGVLETKALVDYALSQSALMPEWTFVLRSHPALPWAFLAGQFGYSLGRYSSVLFSQGVLRDDIESADLILYWQSAVVLEALLMGCPVVNFSPAGILSYDPIPGCSNLRWNVSLQQGLKDVAEEVFNITEAQYQEQSLLAGQYVQRYFYRVTPERFREFLSRHLRSSSS
ncbi:MAG: hypothetical protein HQL20_00310 [Candidatus Omnitrophica bacterium]|nr:hypothetical protein [Candidatus Omnitrophota bacterium]